MITPMTSIQIPRHIAQATRVMIAPLIFALDVTAVYWQTWHMVYRGHE